MQTPAGLAPTCMHHRQAMNYLAEQGFEPLLLNSRNSMCAPLIVKVIDHCLGPTPDQWVKMTPRNNPRPSQKELTLREGEARQVTPDPSSVPGP